MVIRLHQIYSLLKFVEVLPEHSPVLQAVYEFGQIYDILRQC